MKTCVDPVREITDDEAAAFRRDGWVLLPRYVDTDAVRAMADFLVEHMGTDGAQVPDAAAVQNTRYFDAGAWRDWRFLARDGNVEPFHRVSMSRSMGRNAQRLLGREIGIHLGLDGALVKLPEQGEQRSTATDWHQDWPNLSHDRIGFITFWVALQDVPPERGALRFLTGSHLEGPLGRSLRSDIDLVSQYPSLTEEFDVSPPLHFQAGDATVHHGMMVHSATPNLTEEPRWAWAMGCFPGDVRYTGARFADTDDLGLEPGARLGDHPRFVRMTEDA